MNSAGIGAPRGHAPGGEFLKFREMLRGRSGSPVSRGALRGMLGRLHSQGVPAGAAEEVFEGGTLQGLAVRGMGFSFVEGACFTQGSRANGGLLLALSFRRNTSHGFLSGQLEMRGGETPLATLAVYPPSVRETISLFENLGEGVHRMVISSPSGSSSCLIAHPGDFAGIVRGRLIMQGVLM